MKLMRTLAMTFGDFVVRVFVFCFCAEQSTTTSRGVANEKGRESATERFQMNPNFHGDAPPSFEKRREGKRREGKVREGKGREGRREGKGEGRGREEKRSEGKRREEK